MEKKINKKIPRSISLANTWKQREIKGLLILRDEMLANKIDNKLIQKYLDEQYETINKAYEMKISKYYEKKDKLEKKEINKLTKHKREKAINFLIKSKYSLEDLGLEKEYINKVVNEQYEKINERYKLENKNENINLENVNFID